MNYGPIHGTPVALQFSFIPITSHVFIEKQLYMSWKPSHLHIVLFTD